jgi:hypothetical protein
MGGACSTHVETRNVYRIVVGNSEGRIILRYLGSHGGNNIKIHLKGIGLRM